MYIFWVFFCWLVVSMVIGITLTIILFIPKNDKKFDYRLIPFYLLFIAFIQALMVVYVHFLEQN